MFTGIIEHTGRFHRLYRRQDQRRLEIEADAPCKNVQALESICVNGVCLTVVKAEKKIIHFDLLEETYQKTALRFLKAGDVLNLERALKVGARLGGHFVTGHVDGIGKVRRVKNQGRERGLAIEFPSDLAPFLIPKGSVAVEGVSLTLGAVRKNTFEVYLIPTTLAATSLGGKRAGDRVNLEVDILARYAKGRAF